MRHVQTEQLELGMLIALPVYDDRGRILINSYNELSEKYMQRIKNFGLQGIYVEDDYSSDVDIKDNISYELRARAVQALKDMDIDACIGISKEIVNQLLRNSSWDYGLVDIRSFDEYIYRHSVQVAVLATLIGIGMGLKDKELENLCLAGLLLDIGMMHVGEELSTKEKTLTYMDYANIKIHPKVSVKMLEGRDDIMMTTRMAILQHHENVDGSGYPNGQTGDKIHKFAKILHVADTYDALISKRPFRKCYTYPEAVEYLLGGCNAQFAKEIVLSFVKSVPVYPKGYPIVLSDGREGFVLRNKKGYPLRPVVRLFDGEELDLSEVGKTRNITIRSVMEAEEKFK